MMKKWELVGEWRTVLTHSYASLLGILSAVLGFLAIIAPYINLLDGKIPPLALGILSVACSAAVPYARVVKQERLRILTGAANPQPTALPQDGST